MDNSFLSFDIGRDVLEVPEDSKDAREWPLWTPAQENELELASNKAQSSQPSSISQSKTHTVLTAPPSSLGVNPDTQSSSQTQSQTPPKRHIPRKRTNLLTSLAPKPKPKKLTTLEMSAMDWRAHVNTEESGAGGLDATATGDGGSAIRDELEANRRAGGYLGRVGFLERVEARREELFEREKSGKRRRA